MAASICVLSKPILSISAIAAARAEPIARPLASKDGVEAAAPGPGAGDGVDGAAGVEETAG